MSRSLVDEYEKGADKLALAIRGLEREDMLFRPPADAIKSNPKLGQWSIHEVAIHVADAEMAFADRMKRIIAEDDPKLLGWSEQRFIERLFYTDQSAEDAGLLVEIIRRQMTRILRKLSDADFAKTGTHSERGQQTLSDIVQGAINHVDNHVKFIHEKRKWMGKEMW